MSWLDKYKVTEKGQWEFPGEKTAVPTESGKITMQGVDYPVFGIDNTGSSQLMLPGQEYIFPGTIVFETPIMQKGGSKREPIYVDSKNDPRYRAYNDSLSLYNNYKATELKYNNLANKYNLKTWKDNSAYNPGAKIQPISRQGFFFPISQHFDVDRDYSSDYIKSNKDENVFVPTKERAGIFEKDAFFMYGYKKPVQPVKLKPKEKKYETIYVDSPDDPRYKAYQDSLSLNAEYPMPPSKYKIYPYEFQDTAGFIVGQDKDGNNIVEYKKNIRQKIEPIGYTDHQANKSGKDFNKNKGLYEEYTDSQRPVYKKPVQPVELRKEPQPIQKRDGRLTYDEPVLNTTPRPLSNEMTQEFGATQGYSAGDDLISKFIGNFNFDTGKWGFKEKKPVKRYTSVPQGFKHGGWLDSYQTGGGVDDLRYVDDISFPASSTNVVVPKIDQAIKDAPAAKKEIKRISAEKKARGVATAKEVYDQEQQEAELAQRLQSETDDVIKPDTQSEFDKAVYKTYNFLSNPFDAFGHYSKYGYIPQGNIGNDNLRNDGSAMGSVINSVNPFAWANAATRLGSDLQKAETYTTWGGLGNATMNALEMLPMMAYTKPAAGMSFMVDDFSSVGNYLATKTPLKNTYKLNPNAKGSIFQPFDKSKFYKAVDQKTYDDILYNYELKAGADDMFLKGFEQGKPKILKASPEQYILETKLSNLKPDLSPVKKIELEEFDKIYSAKPDWLKGYQSVYNSPLEVKGLNNYKLGENIADGGHFNKGVFKLDDYPGYLMKHESISKMEQMITDYNDVSLTKYHSRLNNRNVGKVLAEENIGDDTKAFLMRQVKGVPLRNLSPDELKKIPLSSWQQYLIDTKQLAKKNLAVDIQGENVIYNPQDKNFKFFDLSAVDNTDPTFWNNTVLNGISRQLDNEELNARLINNAIRTYKRGFEYNISRSPSDYETMFKLIDEYNLKLSTLNRVLKKFEFADGGGVFRTDINKKDNVKTSAEGYYDYLNSVNLSNGGQVNGWMNKYL